MHDLKLDHFRAALDRIASNNEARARALGISLRTVVRYKVGALPPVIVNMMRCPEIMEALAKDSAAFVANRPLVVLPPRPIRRSSRPSDPHSDA